MRPFSTGSKEKTVRNVVYDRTPRTVSADGTFLSALSIPADLNSLYKDYPRDVLAVLVKIVDGANPKDSSLAAGFAISLLKGPAVGVVCISTFDATKYDSFDDNWKCSPRNHWLERIKIDMNEKALDK